MQSFQNQTPKVNFQPHVNNSPLRQNHHNYFNNYHQNPKLKINFPFSTLKCSRQRIHTSHHEPYHTYIIHAYAFHPPPISHLSLLEQLFK